MIITNLPSADALPRLAADSVRAAARSNPIVFLIGSRQVGKSTLLHGIAADEDRRVLDLDDPSVRAALVDDPLRELESGQPLLIDEVQRLPSLFLALKRAVDRMGTKRKPGHFLITGSANPLSMRQVADGLTGRATYVRLHGLTRRETLGHAAAGAWESLLDNDVSRWPDTLKTLALPRGDWRSDALAGAFPWPRVHLREQPDRDRWLSSYVRNHVDRDLRDHIAIAEPLRYHALMRLAALRIGNLLNQAELGRDARLSQPQVHRWLALMETTFLLTRLPSFGRNRTTRLIKTPKLYWNDTGLAMHLGERSEPAGADLENLIFADLAAWCDAQPRSAAVTYWRTAGGREVDFILEAPSRGLLGIEVKSGRNVVPADAKHLIEFVNDRADEKKRAQGVLLYDGDREQQLHDQVMALPWWKVL